MNERYGQSRLRKIRVPPSFNSTHSRNVDPSKISSKKSSGVPENSSHVSSKGKNLGVIKEKPKIQEEKIKDEDDDVKLSLELEIDESLRDLLQFSSQRTKSLGHQPPLDVTFIQQNAQDLQHKTTVSLGVDEVSQFLDMVNAKGNHVEVHQNVDQPAKVSKNPPNQDQNPQHLEDEELLNFYNFGETDDDFSEELYDRGIRPVIKQQVYTSPQHTFNEIKSKLPCLMKSSTNSHPHGHIHHEHNEKSGTPCLCQHCGMVGILVESQKRPAIPHTPNPKFSGYQNPSTSGGPGHSSMGRHHSSKHAARKIIDLRTKSKSETNLILLKELTTKIASLEDRLNEHEEKTVRKDYFKFVIHKLLTQYSNKINELRNTTMSMQKPSINIATQYSRKNCQSICGRVRNEMPPERENNRYYPVKVSPTRKSSTEEECSAISADRYHRRPFKGKVAKRSANTSAHLNHFDHDIKSIYMSSNEPKASGMPYLDGTSLSPHGQLSAHAIKNLCDMVYNKYAHDKSVPPEKLPKNRCDPTRREMAEREQHGKPMDVSFMSPALHTWHDESEQEFAGIYSGNCGTAEMAAAPDGGGGAGGGGKPTATTIGNSGNSGVPNAKDNLPRHSFEDKIKYLRYLAKRKNVDEAELWANILTQAKRHVRSNHDTVSIQLPHMPNGPDMSELELTLSRLKNIVRQSRNFKKNTSSIDLHDDDDTSTEVLDHLGHVHPPGGKHHPVTSERKSTAR